MVQRLFPLLAGCLGLIGCAAHLPVAGPPPAAGATSWRLAEGADTTRYSLALGEVALGATPLRRPAPVYPTSLLASCPPLLEVPALLIVDAKGHVTEVRVPDEARAGSTRQALIGAVRDAARQWTFSPLLKQRWAADAEGNSHVVDARPLPFSRTYVFRFRCEHGRGSVRSG